MKFYFFNLKQFYLLVFIFLRLPVCCIHIDSEVEYSLFNLLILLLIQIQKWNIMFFKNFKNLINHFVRKGQQTLFRWKSFTNYAQQLRACSKILERYTFIKHITARWSKRQAQNVYFATQANGDGVFSRNPPFDIPFKLHKRCNGFQVKISDISKVAGYREAELTENIIFNFSHNERLSKTLVLLTKD